MNTTEKKVYQLLTRWRRISAEQSFLNLRKDPSFPERKERLELLGNVLTALESWMRILSDDERYVIKRHLVDGINWARIMYEYNTKLKRAVKKSRSTLRRMQSRAIAKIARYVEEQRQEIIIP